MSDHGCPPMALLVLRVLFYLRANWLLCGQIVSLGSHSATLKSFLLRQGGLLRIDRVNVCICAHPWLHHSTHTAEYTDNNKIKLTVSLAKHHIFQFYRYDEYSECKIFVSSDRSSCSDDGLLYIVQVFEFWLSPLMQLMLQVSLKEYQCNWCHKLLIDANWISNVPIFQCSNVFFFS